jgi:DNA topoisomerase I
LRFAAARVFNTSCCVRPGSSFQAASESAISRSVAEVAHYLGNTPAVCRASYIDPRVYDQYNGGLTIGGVLAQLGDHPLEDPSLQGPVEAAVLDLLEDEDSQALQAVG